MLRFRSGSELPKEVSIPLYISNKLEMVLSQAVVSSYTSGMPSELEIDLSNEVLLFLTSQG